jgi:hypothetical protein
MIPEHNKMYVISICVMLALATIIAYELVRHNGFVGFDYAAYLGDNSHVKGGITRGSVFWAFTTPHSGDWHPLTWQTSSRSCGANVVMCDGTAVIDELVKLYLKSPMPLLQYL